MDIDRAVNKMPQELPHASSSRTAVVEERLLDFVLDSVDLADFLAMLCRYSAELGTAGGRNLECSITLLRAHRPPLHAGSTELARSVAAVFSRSGEHRCAQELRDGRPLVINDTADEPRWGECVQLLRDCQVSGALAVPLELEDGDFAVFAFLSPVPLVDGEVVERGARRYVVQTRHALLLALRLATSRQASRDVEAAMISRTAIDLAVGVVMAQQRCSQQEAFGILSQAASHRNRKLRAVATELVEKLGGSAIHTHFGR